MTTVSYKCFIILVLIQLLDSKVNDVMPTDTYYVSVTDKAQSL